MFDINFQIARDSMPAVATDLDAVSAKDGGKKPQDENVAKCPFAHNKHAGDAADDFGIETNGNEQNGKIKNFCNFISFLYSYW